MTSSGLHPRLPDFGRWLLIPLLTALLIFPAGPSQAQSIVLDKDMTIDDASSGWLPYAFATDSLGLAAGVAGGRSGRGDQRQAGLFGAIMASTNQSFSLLGNASDYRIPGSERLFTDSFLLLGHFTDSRYYVDLDGDPSRPRAGSNNSDKNDFVTGESNDVYFEFTLKYPLPIGNARENPISLYRLDRGLLLSGPPGGKVWSPLISGKTTVATKLFYRYQDLDQKDDSDVLSVNTNGVEFRLDYNNTDFPRNPASGSRQRFVITRDFGLFDSSTSWTNLELELTKYLNLGATDWFRHQVLALNFWTSNTPTWDERTGDRRIVEHRPPPGLGSFLGGYDRLRAYPNTRFQDKSAVYYAAEWRMIPYTNPLRELPVFNYFEIDWWQLVAFGEAGRVAPNYDAELFYDSLKWDVGLGLRLMAFRIVVRLDWAISEEGSSAWAMVAQPFAR